MTCGEEIRRGAGDFVSSYGKEEAEQQKIHKQATVNTLNPNPLVWLS